ncbi:MAG: OmpA family protein [Proteobacteria bacterium]|nr:OmpA family protein [Pseudomonadota bacterium]
MRKILMSAALAAALPVAAQAQQNPQPNFYFGAEGGLNWMLNTTVTGYNLPGQPTYSVTPYTGFAVGGVVGYDFVGPRAEIETVYRQNPTNVAVPGTVMSNRIGQLAVMANGYYDFMPGQAFTPYVGAGVGVAFVDGQQSLGSTQFAYQGILGVSYWVDNNIRLSLDGRYYGTTNPQVYSANWTNQNFGVMLGVTVKLGPPTTVEPPAPPPVSAPSFMVFFDWDRATLSAQALNTIKQAADVYKTKGNARITATGHTDTSGPESYNMALSLRRANAVKDALVRDGVPATAISVVGKGEQGLLVPTADGVREPQNRRVVIVIQ